MRRGDPFVKDNFDGINLKGFHFDILFSIPVLKKHWFEAGERAKLLNSLIVNSLHFFRSVQALKPGIKPAKVRGTGAITSFDSEGWIIIGYLSNYILSESPRSLVTVNAVSLAEEIGGVPWVKRGLVIKWFRITLSSTQVQYYKLAVWTILVWFITDQRRQELPGELVEQALKAQELFFVASWCEIKASCESGSSLLTNL